MKIQRTTNPNIIYIDNKFVILNWEKAGQQLDEYISIHPFYEKLQNWNRYFPLEWALKLYIKIYPVSY